jgi:hypothetical protein
MPVISYERESWSLDVRVEHSLGTSDHRVLTLGPKRGEVWDKFTHEGPEGSSIPSLTMDEVKKKVRNFIPCVEPGGIHDRLKGCSHSNLSLSHVNPSTSAPLFM